MFLYFVTTRYIKVRFLVGLRKEVKGIVASVSCTQYGQVVEASTRIERSLRLAPQIA